jgi:hypothetical protein
MKRGETLLLVGMAVALLIGCGTEYLLAVFSSFSPVTVFGLSVLSCFIGFILFGYVVTRLGR